MTDTTVAISSHGTILAVQLTPGGAFTDVAQVGDLTLPELMRKEFDASVHGKNIDQYVHGILRRGAFSFPINFLPTNGTHDHLTGMYKLLIDNTITGFRHTYPDAGNTQWISSGQVQAIKPKAPVDGLLSADVTLRFSGFMMINGVVIGT
jgi:hypothetical protein